MELSHQIGKRSSKLIVPSWLDASSTTLLNFYRAIFSKRFACNNTFSFPRNLRGRYLLPFFRWGYWGMNKFSNLIKVTKLTSYRAAPSNPGRLISEAALLINRPYCCYVLVCCQYVSVPNEHEAIKERKSLLRGHLKMQNQNFVRS